MMGSQAETEVRSAIETFMNGVRQGDIKTMENVIAHEPDIVFYGSQAGDKEMGWDAIKASFEEQFVETSKIKTEVLGSTVSVVGELAWAAYDLRYGEEGGPAKDTFESRWTCVLRRYPEGWKYVHMHHSRGR